MHGAIRGAEHRSLRGISPQGRGKGFAAIAKRHMECAV
jgi:hypothetical protein